MARCAHHVFDGNSYDPSDFRFLKYPTATCITVVYFNRYAFVYKKIRHTCIHVAFVPNFI